MQQALIHHSLLGPTTVDGWPMGMANIRVGSVMDMAHLFWDVAVVHVLVGVHVAEPAATSQSCQ